MASTMSRVLRTGLALMLIVPLPELPTLLELEKTGVTCPSSEQSSLPVDQGAVFWLVHPSGSALGPSRRALRSCLWLQDL